MRTINFILGVFFNVKGNTTLGNLFSCHFVSLSTAASPIHSVDLNFYVNRYQSTLPIRWANKAYPLEI